MPERNNFTWQPDDLQKLERAARNYNAKISRLEKSGQNATLPPRVSVKELKSEIGSRYDYRNTLNTLRDFTNTPKETGYKWSSADERELAKAVKNFNAKISRLEKKDPKRKASLPEKISARDIKNIIETRHDFNREINSLKRFSDKGSEELVNLPGMNKHNIQLTKWQKDDMQRRTKNINRKRQRRLETIADIEMTSGGQDLGYRKGDLGLKKISEQELAPVRPFTDAMDYGDLRQKQKGLRKESSTEYWNEKDKVLKENYIDALYRNFPEEDIQDIVDEIEDTDFATFRKVFEAEGGDFELLYPGDTKSKSSRKKDNRDGSSEQYLNKLKSIWLPKTPKK